jgi:hypothetical protein
VIVGILSGSYPAFSSHLSILMMCLREVLRIVRIMAGSDVFW